MAVVVFHAKTGKLEITIGHLERKDNFFIHSWKQVNVTCKEGLE